MHINDVKLVIWSLRLILRRALIWDSTLVLVCETKFRNTTPRDCEIMNIVNQLDPIGKNQPRKRRTGTERALRIVLDVIRFYLD